jgi:uracil-DNA glycosylase family 4
MLDFDPLASAVYGFGPGSSRDHALIMSIGEAPGEEEYYKGRPFVGRSGEEQEWYLSACDYSSRSWYKTNVVKTYIVGNPDPTPELISFWRQHLLDEIRDKQPRLIIAVGRFAARFFLDPDCDLEDVHRLLFTWHEPSTNRLIYILPIYHPAFGFHSDDMKPQIAADYATVAKLCKILKANPDADLSEFLVTADEFEGKEQYHDVGGRELVSLLEPYEDSILKVPLELGVDTEGWTHLPWSGQASPEPGIGYVLRCSRDDFAEGIKYLQTCANRGTTFVTHQAGSPSGCMIDTQICRAMGLELRYAEIWDTMYAAYLLRLESKSLKTLAYRWLRMKMEEYTLLIGDIGKQKQVDYLKLAATRKWDKPDTVVIRQSDGSYKPKQYKSIGSYIDRIVGDVESGKTTAEGPTDPTKRWRKIPKFVRAPVERLYGHFPFGTLDDVPLERAIWYAARDSDATIRLKPKLTKAMNDREIELNERTRRLR